MPTPEPRPKKTLMKRTSGIFGLTGLVVTRGLSMRRIGVFLDELGDVSLLQAGEDGLIEFAVSIDVMDEDIVRDGDLVEIG